jgi:tRNA-uridine 2-sulfurtransferase
MKAKQKTILLGLSGGVDSSIAALLLKKQGYKVIAVFLRCFSKSKNSLTNQCSWIEERKYAKKIAILLNIPLITLNLEKEYNSHVIQPMFKAYKKGLTPNPDIACNTIIKFPLLYKKAKSLNCNYIATGHYAKIKSTNNGFQLFQAKDKTKDQSYFLSELTQFDLSHTIFPVGNLTKSEVRLIAKQNKFPNYNKKGTRGICFIGKINMQSFLKQKIKTSPGKILDPNNKIIGTHPGISYFTIGQRIGPRLHFKSSIHLKGKHYIAKKNPKTNTITIAPKNSPFLKTKKIKLIKFHKINPKISLPKKNLKARYRHLGSLIQGKLTKHKSKYNFTFNKPQQQIAQGQQLVIYKGQELIASGEMRY